MISKMSFINQVWFSEDTHDIFIASIDMLTGDVKIETDPGGHKMPDYYLWFFAQALRSSPFIEVTSSNFVKIGEL